MTATQLNQLRQQFLDFAQAHGHAIIPSASLLPENDSSTLFTSSGMQPLVPYFLGQTHPAGKRLADSQKSFRAVDIDEVGDARHTTFFEMLGNWSLGDYFKKEQLTNLWEFLTTIVQLDPHRLYVTVFAGDEKLGIPRDEEAITIWQTLFAQAGIEAKVGERIFTYDASKNWWSRSGTPAQMPAGEIGGTDSEIFYDFGQPVHAGCHPNCDCGRFIEIGNSVFMEYRKTAAGTFEPLPKKNVDYGGGLERLLMAKENQADIFLTSAFRPFLDELTTALHLNYQTADEKTKRALRIIVDHLRSSIMLLAEGVTPSNKGQGYVLRRLLRRSLLMAKQLSLPTAQLTNLVPLMAELYGQTYPEIMTNQATIEQGIAQETAKFSQTVNKGLKEIEKLQAIDGKTAFFLYETYGFPWELTQEIVAKRGLTINEADFLAAAKQHREESKLQSDAKFKGGLADHEQETVKFHTVTHLLLAALRQFVDPHCLQKGSNITAERARFDFTCSRALTSEELTQIEQQINDWIKADLPVTKQILEKEEALALVGGSLFADRYPEQVSVYQIDTASQEICIGPHVTHTGEIGAIKIKKQESVSAGVRRLYLIKA